MNVIQITPAYPPASGYGGGPAVCENISKRLIDRDHTVSVLTTTADDEGSTLLEGWETRDDIQVYRVPLWSNTLSFQLKIFLPRNFEEALESVLPDADVVHIHDYRTPLTLTTVKCTTKYDIPVVLQPHGTVPRKDRLVILKQAFDTIWGGTVFEGVDQWFALNTKEKQAIKQYASMDSTVSIVPNGISLSTAPDPEYGEFRQKQDIPDSTFLILYLGRLHKSKRVDLLLKAASEMESEDFQVIVAGPDDGDEDRLQKLCTELQLTDQVQFVGRISEKDKWRAFKDASVFVTPAFYGFPLTFLEAMSQRTPVVATNLGDTLDETGENGIHIIDGTSAALAQNLDSLMRIKDNNNALSDTAYKRVQDRYTWDSVVDQIEEIYRAL